MSISRETLELISPISLEDIDSGFKLNLSRKESSSKAIVSIFQKSLIQTKVSQYRKKWLARSLKKQPRYGDDRNLSYLISQIEVMFREDQTSLSIPPDCLIRWNDASRVSTELDLTYWFQFSDKESDTIESTSSFIEKMMKGEIQSLLKKLFWIGNSRYPIKGLPLKSQRLVDFIRSVISMLRVSIEAFRMFIILILKNPDCGNPEIAVHDARTAQLTNIVCKFLEESGYDLQEEAVWNVSFYKRRVIFHPLQWTGYEKGVFYPHNKGEPDYSPRLPKVVRDRKIEMHLINESAGSSNFLESLKGLFDEEGVTSYVKDVGGAADSSEEESRSESTEDMYYLHEEIVSEDLEDPHEDRIQEEDLLVFSDSD